MTPSGAQGNPIGAAQADTPASRAPAVIDRRMLEALVCPVTHAPLRYDADRQELVSRAAHLAYPIRNAIPIMLASEAREID
jgi:uncharacterized protein YbaR (Trm112 family)